MARGFNILMILGALAITSAAAVAAPPASAPDAPKKPKYFMPPRADLKQQIIWGSECETPDGCPIGGLRFGGEDQKADDGAGHTQIKVDGKWMPIVEELRKANPRGGFHIGAKRYAEQIERSLGVDQFAFFESNILRPRPDTRPSLEAEFPAIPCAVGREDTIVKASWAKVRIGIELRHDDIWYHATDLSQFESAFRSWVLFDQAADLLDAEPAPRALSPIAYDAKTKLFVIFGGDHLDYMTNDTWVFDPAKKQWRQQHPRSAPPPRANHTLTATGDGEVKLSGGMTHNNIDIWYMGPLYQLVDDGDWVYDIAADTWTSESGAKSADDNIRAYRGLNFVPEAFMKGDKPDAAANEAKLKELPVNTWVAMKPPVKPAVNRDWGTAVIDPDHDVMLRWSGGHCAHGGSDVPMYHFATNRWELPFPVEFPLGQCYTNTEYPEGVNFNRRPWVTGHTYKSYDYDPTSKQMVFVGRATDFFAFDPAVGDWISRSAKPRAMSYGGGFYDLLCKRTADGVVCWTKEGSLFRYDGKAKQWSELALTGEKIPGSTVDSAGIDYDAKRDRVLLFPAAYGKQNIGQVFAIDLKENKASKLDPAGMDLLAGKIGFLRETCYHADADLVVCGSNIVQPDGGFLTPAFDCAANTWKLLKLDGVNPAGKTGRNVSMGFMYDAKRRLIWSVDTGGEIYVLRLDAAKAFER